MPLFEFKCSCGKSEEHLQAFSKRQDFVTCRECGGEAKRVEVSKTSFTLKGTGWFVDGYHK